MTELRLDPTSLVLTAVCGINCRMCLAHIREKKACPGCRGDYRLQSVSCGGCKIRNCEKRVSSNFEFCFECDEFPCTRLVRLDKRYKTNYGTSPIENLLNIQKFGVEWFVESENQKWVCPACGEMLCMHERHCRSCGFEWHTNKLKK